MISPYALLTASRPKSAASIVTPYDHYSAVQNREDMPSPPPESPASPAPVRIQGARTHYIRDIGQRHNNAVRRATFSAPPSL